MTVYDLEEYAAAILRTDGPTVALGEPGPRVWTSPTCGIRLHYGKDFVQCGWRDFYSSAKVGTELTFR